MFIWILLAVGVYVLLAVVFGRFRGGGALRRIRDEIFEEALPSSPTGGGQSIQIERPGFRWTEAVNLTASDRFRSPAEKRGQERQTEKTAQAGTR